MSDNDDEEEQQDRAFSLPGLGQLASSAAGASPLGQLNNLRHNPVVDAAVNLQRRHPGEMVFLEVAAAGALLYGHQKRKGRQEQYRQDAEEDLKRRGWDGGAARNKEDSVRRQNSGLQVPSPGGPPRPLSAPPAQGWQQGGPPAGKRGDADLAYGAYRYSGPSAAAADPTRFYDDGLAYGKSYQMPPPDQPYLPPQGPPPPAWQPQAPPPGQQYNQPYPQQQYGAPTGPGQWQAGPASPPPLQQVRSWGPGGQQPPQQYPPYQGPPMTEAGWGYQPPPEQGQYGYSPQGPGPY